VSPPVGFLLSAFLGILSFPPVGIWPLAYAALVPFLTSAVSSTPRRALLWGYVSGFVFFAGILYWIGLNSGTAPTLAWTSAAAMVAILATIWAITAWAVSCTAKKSGLYWAAALFVALTIFFEVFWGTGEMGFPWAIWAVTQTGFLPAAQMAEIGDVYLISLWVLIINALLFLAWCVPQRRKRSLTTCALVFLVPVLFGAIRLYTFSMGPSVPVAAVQGNTPMEEKWQKSVEEIFDNYLALTESLTKTETVLAVWPETATPMPLRYRAWASRRLQMFADSSGISLFTGATDYKENGSTGMLPYNAAFLYQPGKREPFSYAKIHLVPFGERIPGQKFIPALGKIRLGQAEFRPGETPVVFPTVGRVPPFGCMICFEVLFPEIAADLVKGGAYLLANITEDGWYGNSSGPYQHLALTRLRAIAARRGIIRAANTGISALILPTGELKATLAYNQNGTVHGLLPAQTNISLAVRLARIWLPFYALLLMVVLAGMWNRGRRGRTAPKAA